MSKSLQRFLNGLVAGIRDAILGTLKVYKMDSTAADTSPKQRDEPMSTLAMRRAGKRRQKEGPKESEPKMMNRLLLCCAWNGGVFLLSVLAFDFIILPFLQWLTESILGSQNPLWSSLASILSVTFKTLWVLPLFVLSKVVNALWFQDIADAAYRKSRGRPQLPSISKLIADILFSLVLQSFFLLQGMLAQFLPIPAIGQLVGYIHMSMLYSLYAFEYKWFNMGWDVQKRLSCMESGWPYYCGFGLPLAVMTTLSSSYVINGCIFSILFPLFIISANEATTTTFIFDFPLRLFALVVAISNSVFQFCAGPSAPPGGNSVIKIGVTTRHARIAEPSHHRR